MILTSMVSAVTGYLASLATLHDVREWHAAEQAKVKEDAKPPAT
jgi:hypothetical protein